MRPPETPLDTAPVGPDPVLATLSAAAHAALDAGEVALVAELMRLIDRQRCAVAPPETVPSTVAEPGGA